MDANRYLLRPADRRDAALVTEHRRRMFEEAGMEFSGAAASFHRWLDDRLSAGTYIGWIVSHDALPVAGIGMMLLDWPPHPHHPENHLRGYILNLFVEPEHRRRGIAGRLMEQCYAHARGLDITYLVLHASAMGRPLYERDGWRTTNEMSFAFTR